MWYNITRWWYGRVLGVCNSCKEQVCMDYPTPGEHPYFEQWRIKKGWLQP